MNNIIIIGGGPCGMTLAWLLAKNNINVTLIDKNSSLGGCHRVTRQNNLFSEHGPRVYINNFKNFMWLFNDLGINFHKLFVPYKCDKNKSIITIIKKLNINEFYHLSKAFIFLNKNYNNITMEEWLNKNKFRENIIYDFDYLCRVVDGGGIDKFTLYNFIQILNYNIFYKIYQPNKPNDKGFIKKWEKKLKEKNVKIIKNTNITKINIYNNNIQSIIGNNIEYKADKYIMAIPPEQMALLLNDNKLTNWSKLTNYYDSLSITFHWNKKIKVKSNCNSNNNKYGIVFVILSDYMNFNKTVISTLITRYDKNKSVEEYKKIIYNYLKSFNKDLPLYDNALLAPYDTAFISTKYNYIPFDTKYNNLYNCGTHNGYSDFPFTTIESAVVNAISLSNKILLKKYPIKHIFTLYHFFIIIIIILLIYLKN